MQEVKYWEVHENYSEDGRRMNDTQLGLFSDYGLAKSFAKDKGNYHGDAQVTLHVLKIADTVAEIEEIKKQNAREEALAKLTWEEKKLLGL